MQKIYHDALSIFFFTKQFHDDGSKKIIVDQLARGDTFPGARLKAWNHVILEISFCTPSVKNEEIKKFFDNLSLLIEKKLLSKHSKTIKASSNIIDSSNKNSNKSEFSSPLMLDGSKRCMKDGSKHNSDESCCHVALFSQLNMKKKLSIVEPQELSWQKKKINMEEYDGVDKLADDAFVKFASDASNSCKSVTLDTRDMNPSKTIQMKENKKGNCKSSTRMSPSSSNAKNRRKHRTSRKPDSSKRKPQK